MDSTTYTASSELVKSILAEAAPDVSTAPGTIVDGLVIKPQSILAAEHTSRIEAAAAAASLADIVDGLASVTDADVDNLVSNYFITRQPAVKASGYVKIVVSANNAYTIQQGFELAFSTLRYTAKELHRVYPAGTTTVTEDATTHILVPQPDLTYYFVLPVTALQDGLASRLAAGTAMTIITSAAGMVSASVYSDFVGGTLAETNEDLLARAAKGVTASVIAGQEHTAALVAKNYPTYQIYGVGIGSALMTRDRENLFGISSGGKTDIYVKTSNAVNVATIRVTGTVTNDVNKTVTATLSRAQAAGVYRIVGMRPANVTGIGGIAPTTVTAAVATTSGFNPVLTATADLAFSARHTLTVVWNDTLGTGTFTNGQTREYDVDVYIMPDLLAFDTFMTSAAVRPAGLDVLIKAGVPCRVGMTLTVYTPPTVSAPDAGVIKSAVANKIATLPFNTTVLSSYTVHKAIAEVAAQSDVLSVSMSGLILAPSGTDLSLASGVSLTIPSNPAHKVGPENTFFSCGIADIAVVLA